ncbi:MAG: ROK family protein [Planctomycetota bacterium]|jgi:glucokinase|nr:ROK family protein [Planctomycetota bacterium]
MTSLLCGIDIGGTKMAIGLVRPDGGMVAARTTSRHLGMDEAGVLDLAADMVRGLCAEAGVDARDLPGAAVGMAGHMRSRTGVVITTSNLPGFKNYPLARELSGRLGVRVILENDANCQAWAEHRFGAGRGHRDMIFVTVSTGIGAGIVINDRLYRGHSGTAGEIGHTIIEPGSDAECSCGNKGCFMAHACTLNLDRLATRKSRRIRRTRIFSPPDGGVEREPAPASGASSRRLDGRRVYEHFLRGDPVAVEIVNEYADYLGIMLYNLFQIFNPPLMVMGGGLMNWEGGFFERMRGKFDELAKDMLYDPVAIVKAAVGESSGVIGAAALLLEDGL